MSLVMATRVWNWIVKGLLAAERLVSSLLLQVKSWQRWLNSDLLHRIHCWFILKLLYLDYWDSPPPNSFCVCWVRVKVDRVEASTQPTGAGEKCATHFLLGSRIMTVSSSFLEDLLLARVNWITDDAPRLHLEKVLVTLYLISIEYGWYDLNSSTRCTHGACVVAEGCVWIMSLLNPGD